MILRESYKRHVWPVISELDSEGNILCYCLKKESVRLLLLSFFVSLSNKFSLIV